MAKEKILELSDVLENVDFSNIKYYDSLNDEQKKAFAPFVVLKCISSTEDKQKLHTKYHHIAMANTANVNFWTINSHPKLQWMLLSIIGLGKKLYHPWIPVASGKGSKSKIDLLIETCYPDANKLELSILKKKLTKDDMINLINRLGLQDNDIKDIIKEIESVYGKET